MSNRRIIVLNPNSSDSVTRAMDAALIPLKLTGRPTIQCVTLRSGPAAIESDDDVAMAAPLVRDYVREMAKVAGAFVVACFSDPGLEPARKATRVPVFGIAESGYLTALTRGARFGVISILESSVARHRRQIRALGIESRLAGDLSLGLGVLELSDSGTTTQKLEAVGQALKQRHRADVLVLGCAGLAGYRADLERAVGIPVIEPVQAAVALATEAVLATNG